MSDPYLGEIRMFAFNRVPEGWFPCDGSLRSIAQYPALFNLLGTTYGGDGQVTFALPDLRGRVPLHQGTGVGLSAYGLGEVGGSETVTLFAQNMPPHTHALHAATTGTRTSAAAGNVLGSGEADVFNRDTANAASLAPVQLAASGNSVPHENMQPSLCVNFCIAWNGLYPSQT